MTKLTVPSALYDTACAVAQALDTDSGGAASWGVYSEEITTYSTEGTFGRDPGLLTKLFSDATQLHEFVLEEYAARFSEHAVPTLAECDAFCAGCVITEAGVNSGDTTQEPPNELS